MTVDKKVYDGAASEVVLELRLPVHIYRVLRAEGYEESGLSENAREGLAARLYAEHRLSIGQAAELAGAPIVKFMELLRYLNVPVVEYGQEEYTGDLETIDRLLGRE